MKTLRSRCLPNGVSERKTVLWTVFREAVLPKARSTGRAAKRTTCTTMRRRARWGTAVAAEGATIHVPLAWQADYIHGFAAITYRPRCGRITYHPASGVDYIPPFRRIWNERITYAPAAQMHTDRTAIGLLLIAAPLFSSFFRRVSGETNRKTENGKEPTE